MDLAASIDWEPALPLLREALIVDVSLYIEQQYQLSFVATLEHYLLSPIFTKPHEKSVNNEVEETTDVKRKNAKTQINSIGAKAKSTDVKAKQTGAETRGIAKTSTISAETEATSNVNTKPRRSERERKRTTYMDL